MFRFVRELPALVSIAGFVWMICQAVQFAG